MRLIDADALIEWAENVKQNRFDKFEVEKIINFAPTIDAEPVKHGEWIFNPTDAIDMMFAKPKCSECGFESSDGGNYCSNCGAKMDKE